MNNKISKFNYIKDIGVFKDFNWNTSMRDKGNNVISFKTVNIIYGRNYSGKTTLSRIFRAFETGALSSALGNSKFEVVLENKTILSEVSLQNHDLTIRVFNNDFVKENLRFIYDENSTINSFAIIGEDNNRLEEEITKLEALLGFPEDPSGLTLKHIETKKEYDDAKKKYENEKNALDTQLREKANRAGTGIKHNTLFGNANYNVAKIQNDIDLILNEPYIEMSSSDVELYTAVLRENPKPRISTQADIKINFSKIITLAKDLIETKITVSEPIQELLADAVLSEWVHRGRELHSGKHTICAFCGGRLNSELWNRLDKHFNSESENLQLKLNRLVSEINEEIDCLSRIVKIDFSSFYCNFSKKAEEIQSRRDCFFEKYILSLQSVSEQLRNKANNIFSTYTFTCPNFDEKEISYIISNLNTIINDNNKNTITLNEQHETAKTHLRLHEVFKFMVDINYKETIKYIIGLSQLQDKAKKLADEVDNQIFETQKKLNDLKAKLKDETKGAQKVNYYLQNYFGHHELSLRATEDDKAQSQVRYRFDIIRDDQKAYNLSEGESSLIAFCYFMAKLEDSETKGSLPIVWIDDPISSLDANHIFFVYSLIDSVIKSPTSNVPNKTPQEHLLCAQLFISTHNLNFFKYLNRMKKGDTLYCIVERSFDTSAIKEMPGYMQRYVTEFNYLFHQIFICANATSQSDENYGVFYNFGNNARKFLEAFLYYKYPNLDGSDNKLKRFFGDSAQAFSLINRITNELSHLEQAAERAFTPNDISEIHTTAKFILETIKENDFAQYTALLESIGEKTLPA